MKINGEEHNDLCVGIDLGTTNSVLATVNIKPNGESVSKVIDIPRGVAQYSVGSGVKLQMQKRATLPSFVYYDESNDYRVIVGDFAKTRYSLRPHLVAKSIKSQMGQKDVSDLSPEVPDKTPAAISARILKYMLRNTEKICRSEIDDAIITVPANFNSVMCQATRDAAELAGIKVRNANGTERPILLSEPNAVIYDFINQVKNGELPNTVLDLSAPKYVLVFDFGGGTLDITLHEIARRIDHQDVLKVDEIATNRYTLLGGDDFDDKIAQTMFEHYLNQYRSHPDVVTKLKREEKAVMPQLLSFAENLKIDLSMSQSDTFVSSGWDDDDDDGERKFNVGGNIISTGYAYDDVFTAQDIEKILQPFMGNGLKFSDYKHLEDISKQHGTKNIIFPILDVLAKAAQKLGEGKLRIDAVLMNGGMSRFYMIVDRLKEFFGMEPIVALDPDQAVARGAAIYHYYLHLYEALKDDMKLVGIRSAIDLNEQERRRKKNIDATKGSFNAQSQLSGDDYAKIGGIQFGNNILNDSLYLGTKNGSQVEIIATGESLPYCSELKTGFFLSPGTRQISIPIKIRELDGTYHTIASGDIIFKNKYPEGAYVAFIVEMSMNKLITMRAWTCKDREGTDHIEEGHTAIDIDTAGGKSHDTKNKVLPQAGTKLDPHAELHSIEQFCKKFQNASYKKNNNSSQIAKEIRTLVSSVFNAGNPQDFAEPLLESLSHSFNEEYKQRCLVIARKIGLHWTESQRAVLAAQCMTILSAELQGLDISIFSNDGAGRSINTKIQAIYTLHTCASSEQLEKLAILHEDSRYLEACLYTHAKTKTNVDWIYECFHKDYIRSARHLPSNLQNSAYAIGVALMLDGRTFRSTVKRNKVATELCNILMSHCATPDEAITCVMALGLICDQRRDNPMPYAEIYRKAQETLRDIENIYYPEFKKFSRMRDVALKMIEGTTLAEDEERYLLTKLDI